MPQSLKIKRRITLNKRLREQFIIGIYQTLSGLLNWLRILKDRKDVGKLKTIS